MLARIQESDHSNTLTLCPVQQFLNSLPPMFKKNNFLRVALLPDPFTITL